MQWDEWQHIKINICIISWLKTVSTIIIIILSGTSKSKNTKHRCYTKITTIKYTKTVNGIIKWQNIRQFNWGNKFNRIQYDSHLLYDARKLRRRKNITEIESGTGDNQNHQIHTAYTSENTVKEYKNNIHI
mgnify:CR=1 FL=1